MNQPASFQYLETRRETAAMVVSFLTDAVIEHEVVTKVGEELFALQEAFPDQNFLLAFPKVIGLS
ncbi:MAG: hypothetical protein N2C14_12345, partial [Planctomycetales bacterium]